MTAVPAGAVLHEYCQKLGQAMPQVQISGIAPEVTAQLVMNLNGIDVVELATGADAKSAKHLACEQMLFRIFPTAQSFEEIAANVHATLSRKAEAELAAQQNADLTPVGLLVTYCTMTKSEMPDLFAQPVSGGGAVVDASPIIAGVQYMAYAQADTDENARNEAATQILQQIYPDLPMHVIQARLHPEMGRKRPAAAAGAPSKRPRHAPAAKSVVVSNEPTSSGQTEAGSAASLLNRVCQINKVPFPQVDATTGELHLQLPDGTVFSAVGDGKTKKAVIQDGAAKIAFQMFPESYGDVKTLEGIVEQLAAEHKAANPVGKEFRGRGRGRGFGKGRGGRGPPAAPMAASVPGTPVQPFRHARPPVPRGPRLAASARAAPLPTRSANRIAQPAAVRAPRLPARQALRSFVAARPGAPSAVRFRPPRRYF
eukprot:TRINITY_DN2107_c0_g1_i2.p1 TRINITY_DN2107_c0_g1~~TRINITY_DN2107_c0_g1_i2.p1  ORF type:complete len:427 (-),score=74.46 TRINITY_DN2107_c0_g1_i2:55-1335(-)